MKNNEKKKSIKKESSKRFVADKKDLIKKSKSKK